MRIVSVPIRNRGRSYPYPSVSVLVKIPNANCKEFLRSIAIAQSLEHGATIDCFTEIKLRVCNFAIACVALVSEQVAWCIAHIVGVLPTFLLCVVPTSKVPNSISADVTNKTDSTVMRRIENRTRGETANMVTVPTATAGYPLYPYPCSSRLE